MCNVVFHRHSESGIMILASSSSSRVNMLSTLSCCKSLFPAHRSTKASPTVLSACGVIRRPYAVRHLHRRLGCFADATVLEVDVGITDWVAIRRPQQQPSSVKPTAAPWATVRVATSAAPRHADSHIGCRRRHEPHRARKVSSPLNAALNLL